MRHLRHSLIILALALHGGAGFAAGTDPLTAAQRAQGFETLAAQDGWAAADGGTRGGSAADEGGVFVVGTRAELVAALGGNNARNARDTAPRVIFIRGTIDLAADDDGRELGEQDWADRDYDRAAYLKAFDPASYGRDKPATGPQETARRRSQQAQGRHVVINVGSNKTLIGLGSDARLIHGGLRLRGIDNVILRNLTIEDAYDYFPAWDPLDGDIGNWNAQYDNVQIQEATHIWVDHCTFSDGARTDDKEPVVFGKTMIRHDGLLDITNSADLITVSNNIFRDHHKTNLIGASDDRPADEGKLRITFRDNLWENNTERQPRVRYGTVDVYNNYYRGTRGGAYPWSYGIGISTHARVYSESNYFALPADIPPYKMIQAYNGELFVDHGSMLNGQAADLSALWNAYAADPTHKAPSVKPDLGWAPSLRTQQKSADGATFTVLPAAQVPEWVMQHAGAGKL